jgi:hypothetical protein
MLCTAYRPPASIDDNEIEAFCQAVIMNDLAAAVLRADPAARPGAARYPALAGAPNPFNPAPPMARYHTIVQ